MLWGVVEIVEEREGYSIFIFRINFIVYILEFIDWLIKFLIGFFR